jgi:type VI secretion system protein VasI
MQYQSHRVRGLVAYAITIVALLSFGAFAQSAPNDQALAKCSAISDSVKRLECFDNVAGERGDTPKTETKSAGEWDVRKQTSPVDDSATVFISVQSTDPISTRMTTTKPTLAIVCREHQTSVYVDWGVFLHTEHAEMTLRTDKEKAIQVSWAISTNYEAAGHWDTKSAIPFIKSLVGKDELFARVTPYGESAVSATFDLAGLDEALKPLREACNW